MAKRDRDLARLERKLDCVLCLQGMTLEELARLHDDDCDAARIEELIVRLKASRESLSQAVDQNQPPA